MHYAFPAVSSIFVLHFIILRYQYPKMVFGSFYFHVLVLVLFLVLLWGFQSSHWHGFYLKPISRITILNWLFFPLHSRRNAFTAQWCVEIIIKKMNNIKNITLELQNYPTHFGSVQSSFILILFLFAKLHTSRQSSVIKQTITLPAKTEVITWMEMK